MEHFTKSFTSFKVKEVDGNPRRFKGTATTAKPDRVNDVLLPSGAVFELPIPLLMQHKLIDSVGLVISALVTDLGIEVEFEIPEIEEEGELKKIVDKAFQSIKYGLVKGLSVGFLPDWSEVDYREDGGLLFKKWEWYELSLVTVPCNRDGEVKALHKAFENSGCKKQMPVVKSTHKVVDLGQSEPKSAKTVVVKL